VSNFKPAHLERLAAGSDLVPAVNQIELNPGVGRVGAREYDAAHGIVTQAWSPLGRGELLSDRVITEIAGRHGRTSAQVIVRWHVQHGVSAVPKSTNEARLAANIGVFDFALSETDMLAIDRLDQGEAAAMDSDVEGH